MRQSIAGKITKQVSLLMVAAITILCVGGFLIIYSEVHLEIRRYSLAVLTVFSDLVTFDSEEQKVPLDQEHADIVLERGRYICQWYGVDYAYLYMPDLSAGTLKYVCAVSGETTDGSIENNLIGHEIYYTPTAEEEAVWTGKSLSAYVIQKNEYGEEISTIIRFQDVYGNYVVAGVDIPYSYFFSQITTLFAIIAGVIVLVMLGVYFTVFLIVRRQVSRPAQQLSKTMNDFISGGQHRTMKLAESGPDEYFKIAAAYNSMVHNIDTYLKNINRLTRDREHQNAELEIASQIQQGFLPTEHLKLTGCGLSAVMRPARNVGGDLYDYLPLDDHRVLTVIADVSGKGIAAAMFMTVTLTLIRQFARMELPPAEILRRTNDALLEENPSMLFVTAFVGIYDDTTSLLTYSNGGHNLPYVVGNGLQTLNQATGTILGLFADEQYSQAEVRLRPGDTLFCYTDGVTEAVNRKSAFYGTERLENDLRAYRETANGQEMISFVLERLRKFSDGAEQHDDITMLTLEVRESREWMLDPDIREMEKIKEVILGLPLPRMRQLNLCLAAEECFVNVCSYAFPEGVPEGEKVVFKLSVSNRIELTFIDGGVPFNPLEHIESPDDYDVDTQIGGLGKFIASAVVDDMTYEYRDGKNVLTLVINIEEEKQ